MTLRNPLGWRLPLGPSSSRSFLDSAVSVKTLKLIRDFELPMPSYPDASCTGVPTGATLTVVNGDMEITTANTVIDSKDVRGCVSVRAPGVIIRKSRIACSGPFVIDSYGYTGTWLSIEDSEIDCNDTNGTAVGEEGVAIVRSNIHGCENGFDVDRNFTIQDNYIHDMYQSAEAHTDGIQMWNTATAVTIQHNRIYSNNGTSAIISPTNATLGTVIRDNLLAVARTRSTVYKGGWQPTHNQQPFLDYLLPDGW